MNIGPQVKAIFLLIAGCSMTVPSSQGSESKPAPPDPLYYSAVVPIPEQEGILTLPGDPLPKITKESVAAEERARAQRKARYEAAMLKTRVEVTLVANRMLRELSASTNVELLTLNPDPRTFESSHRFENRNTVSRGFVGGFQITGRAKISGTAEIKKLADALRLGFAESNGESGDCFEPGHALLFSSSDKQYLAILCFRCGRAELREVGNNENSATLLLSRSPEKTFDVVFAAHGLKNVP
jgi:hypothetical protein